MADLGIYAGLFIVALAAGSILPLQSEAALAGLLLADQQPAAALVAVASVGNTLGAVVNWLIGRSLERFRGRRWFPASPAALERSQRWYGRYGRWSLLLSWVPVIGDPLTLAAGILREPLPSFVLLVAVAKTGRYLVLAALTLGMPGGWYT